MKRYHFLSLLVVLLMLIGCGSEGTNTYIEYQVEGKTYRVPDPEFLVAPIPKTDIYFLDLTQRPVSAVPGAAIQWRMHLSGIEDLVGQTLNLDDVNSGENPAIMRIALDKQVSVFNDEESSVFFQVDRMDGEFLEGQFSGENMVWVSMVDSPSRRVNLSGTFRIERETS